jgi:hypothetical protein
MATWTKNADQCIAEARLAVERARQRLRDVCPDRTLAARVALYYDIMRDHEKRLEEMEQAVAEGRPGDAVARLETPF